MNKSSGNGLAFLSKKFFYFIIPLLNITYSNNIYVCYILGPNSLETLNITGEYIYSEPPDDMNLNWTKPNSSISIEIDSILDLKLENQIVVFWFLVLDTGPNFDLILNIF